MNYFKLTYQTMKSEVYCFDKYQEEMLKAFCLEEFDLDKINKEVSKLFEKIKDDPIIRDHLEKYKKIYNLKDLEITLCIMFSFDHFSTFFPMIKDYLCEVKEGPQFAIV